MDELKIIAMDCEELVMNMRNLTSMCELIADVFDKKSTDVTLYLGAIYILCKLMNDEYKQIDRLHESIRQIINK